MKILKISLIIYAIALGFFILYFSNNQNELNKQIEEQIRNIDELETSVAQDIMVTVGQEIYVPAYSNISGTEKESSIMLAINLSIRNTDPRKAIYLSYVDFYNTSGVMVKQFIDKPLKIDPMATTDFYVAQADTIGGVGANFYLEWVADTLVNEPVVEAIMIGSDDNRHFSWNSPGFVVKQK